MFLFNWSNFLNLANSPSCFVIYSRWRKAFLGDKHLPNIVLCFLRRLLLGNGELLYSSFKGLESMAVPQVLICISSISPMLGFIYLLYRKSRSNENFLKLERMRQSTMWPYSMIADLKKYDMKDLKVLLYTFIIKRTLKCNGSFPKALLPHP